MVHYRPVKLIKAPFDIISFQGFLKVKFLPFGLRLIFQDYQTWLDLRELEAKLGGRYITHESDDSRWQMYAQQHSRPYPPHLVPPRPASASNDENGDSDMQGLTERVSIL